VREFPGGIGYVELIYALQITSLRHHPQRIRNWVKASIEGVTKAAEATAKIPLTTAYRSPTLRAADSYLISPASLTS